MMYVFVVLLTDEYSVHMTMVVIVILWKEADCEQLS